MPIRNSKIDSSEAFSVHRRARLNRLKSTSDSEAIRQPDNGDAAVPETPRKEDTGSHVAEAVPRRSSDSSSSQQHQKKIASKDAAAAVHENAGTSVSDVLVDEKSKKSIARGAEIDQLRLNIKLAHPAPGVCPTFDQIAEVRGDDVAFRLVLGKALETYAVAIQRKDVINSSITYTEGAKIKETSRMFPSKVYAEIAKVLNPTGLLSDRAIAATIGYRALAMFIQNDKRPD